MRRVCVFFNTQIILMGVRRTIKTIDGVYSVRVGEIALVGNTEQQGVGSRLPLKCI